MNVENLVAPSVPRAVLISLEAISMLKAASKESVHMQSVRVHSNPDFLDSRQKPLRDGAAVGEPCLPWTTIASLLLLDTKVLGTRCKALRFAEVPRIMTRILK
jgi:hypothetical protein